MRLFLAILVFVASLICYAAVWPLVWQDRYAHRDSASAGYVMPTIFYRIVSFDNEGLMANLMFVDLLTFLGGRLDSGGSLNGHDWRYVFLALDRVTDLDPYFVDPYNLAEGVLAWDANLPHLANQLLKKGTLYRTKDWRLLYYIGFNLFYFEKKYKEASFYIMRSAKIPGSPSYLKTLASRLAYYGGESKTALFFLREMIQTTNNSFIKKKLEIRMIALKGAAIIEESLKKFRLDRGNYPDSLNVLVLEGYLERLPLEPYGGDWVILPDGRVFSTSKFTFTGKD